MKLLLQDIGTFLGVTKRSKKWPRTRKEHMKRCPNCYICNSSKDVDCHHIIPFGERKDLENDKNNLMSLCSKYCHLRIGHLGYWRTYNPNIRSTAIILRNDYKAVKFIDNDTST